MFTCTFRHTIYGYSGNELPPPAESSQTYTYLSDPGEPLEAFKKRMQEIGMRMRQKASEAPKRPYSVADGWDWSFSEVREVPK